MVRTHSTSLVILAVLIAVAASYTSLDIAARIGEASSRLGSRAWLAAAAICMGGGIWSMHFVAMLAYSVPDMTVAYDPFLTVLSLLIAITVTGGGFAVVSRPQAGTAALLLSGLFMGIGILAMHYVGMAAMRMHATTSYEAAWVALSVFIAIGAAISALWLAFRGGGFVRKSQAAAAMGLAVSGMHFAGMQAASFGIHATVAEEAAPATVDQGTLALAVASITFLILVAAIVAAMFDRRFAALVTREALALKRSEEQFRLLYRRTPLPLHSLDVEGRIEEVSDAWLALMHYDRDAVIGRPLINFMTEESARQRLADWKTLLSADETHEREYRLVTREGEIIDVVSTSRVERDEDGNVLRAVGGLVDVTARKSAEASLRQAQKMEAVGQLTGGIAHDFNNVLAVVLGSLEMLRKRVSSDDRALRMVDNAMEGAKRGAALTQRMMSFARRQDLNPQPINIRMLVDGMKEMISRSLGPRIALNLELPPGLPSVQADPNQLEMALLNLAVNARDAMEEGDIRIVADGPESPPGTPVEERFVRVSVIDNGTGMDEATLARAREPFFTTKGVGRGTGLGLAMVSGFAEQSGGFLEITSRKGQGTRVDIWLPVSDAADVVIENGLRETRSIPTRPLQHVVVLVVDDEPLILMSTEDVLLEAGAKVHSATNGVEALEVVRRHPEIGCLLTDYAMPGMTGAQLAAAVRVSHPNMPIIVASGYAEFPEEIAQYPRLQKPFAAEALVSAVTAEIAPRTADVIRFPSG